MQLMIQRVKQVLWALKASVSNNDIDFNLVKKELNDAELSLFLAMSKIDQYHAYRVYLTVEKLLLEPKYNDIKQNQYQYLTIRKAALLHDVGRSKDNFNLAKKIVAVVVDNALKMLPNEKADKIKTDIQINKKPKFMYIYYQHPQLSKELIAKLYDPQYRITANTDYGDIYHENAYHENDYYGDYQKKYLHYKDLMFIVEHHQHKHHQHKRHQHEHHQSDYQMINNRIKLLELLQTADALN